MSHIESCFCLLCWLPSHWSTGTISTQDGRGISIKQRCLRGLVTHMPSLPISDQWCKAQCIYSVAVALNLLTTICIVSLCTVGCLLFADTAAVLLGLHCRSQTICFAGMNQLSTRQWHTNRCCMHCGKQLGMFRLPCRQRSTY